jgi:hypothetical protein
MSKNFLGIFLKLIPRTAHSKHTNIPREKFRIKFGIEILLGPNADCTRYFSHGINLTFSWIFSLVIN